MKRKSCDGSGNDGHGHVVKTELLKLQNSGQFPDETVRIKVSRIH